ncbi:hypothetical protein ACP275_04G061800 [Erythranthe tilingii]
MNLEIEEKSPCGNFVRYKKILGRGAFKDVYKAFDHLSNREVAWSLISVEEEDSKTSKKKNLEKSLCSEAVLLKSLNHKNIMKCHSFWFDRRRKTVNIITELFSGGSLRHHTKKLGCAAIDSPTIKAYGRQILEGLQYLHTRSPKIVHRDIKSDNIFVNPTTGEVKIGDFGLASEIERDPLRSFAGTPEFMAPEYYEEEYNELVDIYAFGLCLMEMATCECPYSECTNPAQIFKKVSTGIKPAALGKVKDYEVKEIIEKCLSPVFLRPSASELLKDPFFFSSSNDTETAMDMDEECSGISSSGSEVSTGGEDSMEDSILSDLHTLYDDMSLGEVANCTVGKPHSSSDYSMNSRITYASSSCAVSKDSCFIVSKPSLDIFMY